MCRTLGQGAQEGGGGGGGGGRGGPGAVLRAMIPCVSLTETSVLGNMKERVKEMRVFGCRLNFWNNVTANFSNKHGKSVKSVEAAIEEDFGWDQIGIAQY